MKGTISAVVVVLIIGALTWFFVKDVKNETMEGEKMMQEKKVSPDKEAMTKENGEVLGKTNDTTTGESMMNKNEIPSMEPAPTMMEVGGYTAYAPEKLTFAKEGKVVLFFRAGWCPTCRAVDADIRAHLSDIPKNVLILDVNYDTEKELKQKYGVTYQHTFVEVDALGNQIAKWQGSTTLQEVLSSMK